MNRVYLPLLAAVAAFPLLWAPALVRAADPQFEALPRVGTNQAAAYGVSRDGSTVVGLANLVPETGLSPAQTEAAMWRNGQLTTLGDLPGADQSSFARSASADGSVIVGGGNATTTEGGHITNADRQAVQWVNGVLMPLANPAGLRLVDAHALSGDGSVIVGEGLASAAGSPDHVEAFRWVNGVATGLGRLANTDYSRAFGVSADGSVVVGDSASLDGSGRAEAFRWANGVMTGLGSTPGNAFSTANAVSADGRVVVGQSYGAAGFPAFRWEDGVMSSIGDLGAGSADALAVSGDGSRIVGWAGDDAFVWDAAHGMHRLADVLRDYGVDLHGWRLLEATGISDDGQTIVGFGFAPDSTTAQGFRVTLPNSLPVPEPAGLSLLVCAVAMTLRRRRPAH